MDNSFEKLYSLIYENLLMNSPVLSGNMKSMIQIASIGENEVVIVIEAPFYDLKKWQKDKQIVYTGPNKSGYSDYATLVNDFGGFGSHNSSEKWANRVCVQAARVIGNEIGATVINELEL